MNMTIKIAYVANFLPTPADSGSVLRASRLARALADVGSLTLYARASDEDAVRYAGHAELAAFRGIRLDIRPAAEHARLARVFASESMARWMAPDDPLGAMLAADHRNHPYDVVVCQQVFAANVARLVPEVPLVLDEHNVESRAMAQVLATLPRLRIRADFPADVSTLEAYEREVWARAALVTCTTDSDAASIAGRSGAPVRVISNGADVEETTFFLPSTRSGHDILFVGSFFWPPNSRAARFLAKEVLPRVVAREPRARLVICGKSPGLEVTLLRRDGVEVTGTVASVQPYLRSAAVYGNALFEGAGSSLKVLEALASGVPLVSTATGVRGHPLEPMRHYLPAEDADSFAETILRVLADTPSFDAQAIAGRAVAESKSWTRVGKSFAALVASVARRETIAGAPGQCPGKAPSGP